MSLTRPATDIASVISDVDAYTTGQHGNGIGSEDEVRQVELLVDSLKDHDPWYQAVSQEVRYPTTRRVHHLRLLLSLFASATEGFNRSRYREN